MDNMRESLIRTSAFIRKEVAGIFRQPRLLAILILGPFLILLIFGLGYTNTARTLDTILVVPEGSKVGEQINDLADRLKGINIIDIVGSMGEADARLDSREVDLIIATPIDPLADIRGGEHAVLEFHHHEIDPLEKIHVSALERAYIDEINREILTLAADRGKSEASALGEKILDAQTDAEALQHDLERGNGSAALRDLGALAEDVQIIAITASDSLAAFEGVQSFGGDEVDRPESFLGNIAEIERLMASLSLLNPEQGDFSAEAEQAAIIVAELNLMAEFLTEIQDLDSNVVAMPFSGKVLNYSGVVLGPIDFYVPAVISLLLQHMAVTMAALAIVREFRSGSIELFRAAPITAFETLTGKSISYLVFTLLLAVILTTLVILGLNTPMLGSWAAYAVVILTLLFTSLSMGFAISAISKTDTQAVQYSMIVLLASIFFSGFFISLNQLVDTVHIVSWLLPATYGTHLLQDIMLRGLPISAPILIGLIIYGLFLFLFAWWRLRKAMSSV